MWSKIKFARLTKKLRNVKDDRHDFAYRNGPVRHGTIWIAPRIKQGRKKKKKKQVHTLRDFYSHSPPFCVRPLLSLPISSGFLIRAIFPGRSHVNFRRPMTWQTRGAQTSMIFRERVSRASREQNSRSAAGRATNPTPVSPSPSPSRFSPRYRYERALYFVMTMYYWIARNVREETLERRGRKNDAGDEIKRTQLWKQLWKNFSINILWRTKFSRKVNIDAEANYALPNT